ncbi:hypothetical protein Ddye_011724 [Dipteronia dyeriana]|uniref:RRM domain-containing protein n=1 Tax=Dipteronia dyeriana TaxID=168575 RepID=A0AAE0CIJ3_9ROSI|nr:hypothetical protein Ddye_011724 [Dipteronia dyeriana]
MKENTREINYNSFVQNRRGDYRENFFSIFVDNLNHKANLLCLWGLFKPFGKVRDIYLSVADGQRRKGYPFVRFASLEEARKVADMTNEMHVYGWPISTKVAQYDWNNKRSSGSRDDSRKFTDDGPK